MRYNGISTDIIADTLSKCKATIISYINNWNNNGIACISDLRGGNITSGITDEIAEDIREIVTNKSPHDFGYEHNKWNALLIARYIKDKYNLEYGKAWITILLKNLNFTYKRGVYKPTLGNPELQEIFKKK